jgi:hypothetical protein
MADLTVIHLWEHWATCHRCTNYTRSKFAWPYYEDFIIGAGEPWQERGCCVPVCGCCYMELMAQEANSPMQHDAGGENDSRS